MHVKRIELEVNNYDEPQKTVIIEQIPDTAKHPECTWNIDKLKVTINGEVHEEDTTKLDGREEVIDWLHELINWDRESQNDDGVIEAMMDMFMNEWC